MAKEKFCSISFDELCAEDFLKNREGSGSENTLFGKTARTKFGDCDAFISHSWSDDGEEKFEALENWAAEFRQRESREPRLWLDKACINQTAIETDLQCLPVFLAGCDKLLILAGPTYTERLWCVLEIFVFLRMGGTLDRVVVVPIDMASEEALEQHFFKQIHGEDDTEARSALAACFWLPGVSPASIWGLAAIRSL